MMNGYKASLSVFMEASVNRGDKIEHIIKLASTNYLELVSYNNQNKFNPIKFFFSYGEVSLEYELSV